MGEMHFFAYVLKCISYNFFIFLEYVGMSFASMSNDTVDLIKNDGTKVENIKAAACSRKI